MIMLKYSYLLSHERQDSSVRFRACGTTWIFRTIYAPDTGIVLYIKLFHISCITVIYSRYIINLIMIFHWHFHCPHSGLYLKNNPVPLSSAEPYEFLVKLRNITWETNYVMSSTIPTLSLQSYIIDSAEESDPVQ